MWLWSRLIRVDVHFNRAQLFRSIRFASTKHNPTNGARRASTNHTTPRPRTYVIDIFDRIAKFSFYVCAANIACHAFWEYGFSVNDSYGISMLPTIDMNGTWCVISKRYRRGRGVQVGDIVSFKHPLFDEEYAIKRVIGLAGDMVLMNTPGKSDVMIQVPEGHCWVVGDNLPQSRDSRTFGVLPLALIKGKVLSTFRWENSAPMFSWVDAGLQSPSEEEEEVD